MQWSLVQTGAELFDLLHAYGLGILLAHACGQPIEMRETNWTYTLTCSISTPPSGSLALLDEILALPDPAEIETAKPQDTSLPIANLDGLLTVLFTTPGVRVLSVADLSKKAQKDVPLLERALKKVHVARTRWKKVISKEPEFGTLDFLERVLRDYQPDTPAQPTPADTRQERDISLVMMLDPSFSYSTHRPISDGLVSHKTSITIRGAPFAVLLATIGAARFLRAHHVGGDLVNCYVPKAERVLLTRDSFLPWLTETAIDASQAILVQWLSYARHAIHAVHARWTGLCYQTIQTQGMRAPIPRGQGTLDLLWLIEGTLGTRESLLSFWHSQIQLHASHRTYEIDALIDALWTRKDRHWFAHLQDWARWAHTQPDTIHSYQLEDVREVITCMHTSIPSLLKKALEQKTGTLRFGHALRLLGDFNAAALRELVEDLETVTTLDHLLSVLALTAQHCQVAAAKTRFMVVPDEGDLGALLSDVEQSSPQTIARFLIVLSALRYPRLTEEVQDVGRLTRIITLLLALLVGQAHGDGLEDASEEIMAQTTVTSLRGERKGTYDHE